MSLYLPLEAPAGHLAFKLPLGGADPPLRRAAAAGEHGRQGHRRAALRGAPGGLAVCLGIYDFGLDYGPEVEFQADRVRQLFQDAFAQAWRGAVENDGFNRSSSRRADVAGGRAPARDREVPATGGQLVQPGYMEEALAANPELARLFVELFRLRFEPQRRGTKAQADELSPGDRGAARRNRQPRRGPDPAQLPQRDPGDAADELLPARRGRRAEAVPLLQARPGAHPRPARPAADVRDLRLLAADGGRALRAGKVARGGIRWSDRREDFRTEILGLMKAQTVKNAVIVPTGAKGGFVLKRPPRTEMRCARRWSSATGSSSAACST